MKWLRKKKAGLTEEDIKRVRNLFISLFLMPYEFIETAPPKERWVSWVVGVTKVRISCKGGIVCFEYVEGEFGTPNQLLGRFWLKFPAGGGFPYWDYQVNEEEIERMDFDHRRAAIPTSLIKFYATHFPFLPTGNYLANDGKFIA